MASEKTEPGKTRLPQIHGAQADIALTSLGPFLNTILNGLFSTTCLFRFLTLQTVINPTSDFIFALCLKGHYSKVTHT